MGNLKQCSFPFVYKTNEEGFSSAQWIILMGFTIVILATLVQILLIEYTRTTTLAALRDASRAGANVVDLKRAVADGSTDLAITACKQSADAALNDLNGVSSDKVECVVGQAGTGSYLMKASIKDDAFNNLKLLPYARVFKSRLKGLSATYTPSEAAS